MVVHLSSARMLAHHLLGTLVCLIWGVSLWEALFVVSRKWSLPTLLVRFLL